MAEFYKGFAFECDVKGRLTIEGNQVQIDGNPVQVVTAPLDGGGPAPVFTADDKTVASARAYIDSSPELRAREHPEVHPMLAAHDFTEHDAGVVLDGYDFSYTNFTQASLLGMSLKGANFHQAILAKANLTCARLEESKLLPNRFLRNEFRRCMAHRREPAGRAADQDDPERSAPHRLSCVWAGGMGPGR